VHDRPDVSDAIAATSRRQLYSWDTAPDRALTHVEHGRRYSARHDCVIGQVVELFDRIHRSLLFEMITGECESNLLRACKSVLSCLRALNALEDWHACADDASARN
jgi:hypothetical protein